MNIGIKKSITIGGKDISVETGKLAKQADGSVVLQMGNTVLLATAVSSKEAKEGIDFLPLTVDYREKFAGAGRIPGGFLRREGRPSDLEILIMRLVDRALRPLFPDDYHADTQVMIQMMSYDGEHMPDTLAGFAASAAIAVSDIPFNGPMSEVRVARVDGEFIINPLKSELEKADMELMIAGTMKDVVMIEGEMHEVQESDLIEAIKIAHEAIKEQCQFQLDLAAEVPSSSPKREYSHEDSNEDFEKKIHDFAYEKCQEVARQGHADKEKRSEGFKAIKEEVKALFTEEELEENEKLIGSYYAKTMKEAVRDVILNERIRLDGRKFDEIRPIWSEVDYLPMVHGSAVFTRGETQSLTTLTLGGKMQEQMIDAATYQGTENFMLHYNFPPFSTGEAYPIRGVSRREVGHGNLALRALKYVLPEDNPYTIRLVSEILESNGSSSMATVCAGTLALMDGGIPIKAPVSGIAMGLIMNKEGKYAVLSDILGDEDHLGDMDFKITGTSKGITACQMDIKVDGLPYEVLTEALEQAKDGRLHILGELNKTISEPNTELKPSAPRVETIRVPNEAIGAIIGPGGKIIQQIQKDTGATVMIEEDESTGEGIVQILAEGAEPMDAATKSIRDIAFPPTVEEGEVYEGKVKSVQAYGVFVEILPGTDGLIHVSEFANERIAKMEDVAKEGDMLKFKVVGRDPKSKKWKLSRKVLLAKDEKKD
ncbi:polyribonucleotide nucleotidyltransferase [Brumimicrobium salinarum]|uniref:Polyribonucleotide nucleotidyltransferase n=1 Tax=Brumimicrobium salinarum TaxID=2058658 RepID=A0A2I0R2Q8_9FLAO|nr:polyribonucleotide nucleotidyltransferase [Brumimicrobium salinarum]PKR80680.1 polyribonucleotide nucleotidyltransferase [Brumimicrobium salinarum]